MKYQILHKQQITGSYNVLQVDVGKNFHKPIQLF